MENILTTVPWWITPSPSFTAEVVANRGRDIVM